MPCDASASTDGAELMDHVTRDEVNVITAESDSGISDALSSQLIQLSFLNPLNTLQ